MVVPSCRAITTRCACSSTTEGGTMKKLFAAAAAICMCTGAAIAEPLTDQDKAYVVASVASVIVLGKCPQYGAVTNSLQTFADKIGVELSTSLAQLY